MVGFIQSARHCIDYFATQYQPQGPCYLWKEEHRLRQVEDNHTPHTYKTNSYSM